MLTAGLPGRAPSRCSQPQPGFLERPAPLPRRALPAALRPGGGEPPRMRPGLLGLKHKEEAVRRACGGASLPASARGSALRRSPCRLRCAPGLLTHI